MNLIKSPLRYPGGKSRVVETISKIIPKFDEFREPFLGGGSVFVYIKQHYPNKKYWVNDLYTELYKFWNMAKNDVDALVTQVYIWREQYPIGKELFTFLNQNMSLFNELETAAAFFIFNRITFSGTTLSGGYSEGAFKGRFTESSIYRLNELSKVIDGALITNLDYDELLNKEGNNVFIFLDPPYFTATKSALYGKNGNLHKSFDHKRFAENMKKCTHKWLITYDNSDYVRELFSFANIYQVNMTYGMRNVTKHSNQKESELFITNYTPMFFSKQYEEINLNNLYINN